MRKIRKEGKNEVTRKWSVKNKKMKGERRGGKGLAGVEGGESRRGIKRKRKRDKKRNTKGMESKGEREEGE